MVIYYIKAEIDLDCKLRITNLYPRNWKFHQQVKIYVNLTHVLDGKSKIAFIRMLMDFKFKKEAAGTFLHLNGLSVRRMPSLITNAAKKDL